MRGKIGAVDTARSLVDLVRRSWRLSNRLRQNLLARPRTGKDKQCCHTPAILDCSWKLRNALQWLRECKR